MLEMGKLQGPPCAVPGTPAGTQCGFWYDEHDLGNGDWGFINLDYWNVHSGTDGYSATQCPNSGASWQSRGGWITYGYPTELTLNGNPPGSLPTYVCVDTGHATTNWQDLKNQENTTRIFPVNDCSGQVDKNGTPAPCPLTPDKYDIVGFSYLYLLHVYRGDDPLGAGTTGSSGTCSTTNNGKKNWAAGDTLDLDTISSASRGWTNTCPPTVPVDVLSDPVITGCKLNGSTVPCATYYTYNSTTHVITWGSTPQTNTSINFAWVINNTTGACGYHPPTSTAICLVVRWDGYVPDSGPISSGGNFGAEGVRLCDRDLRTCPGQ
jgi:hypothetical protein